MAILTNFVDGDSFCSNVMKDAAIEGTDEDERKKNHHDEVSNEYVVSTVA